jgi:hypothetical protein
LELDYLQINQGSHPTFAAGKEVISDRYGVE